MSIFPRIQGGVIAELFTPPTGFTLAQCFAPSVAAQFATDVSAVTPAPQVGWTAAQSGGAWTFTAPAAPPGPTLAQQAMVALDTMDAPGGQAIRCFKAGVAFPSNWQAYTTALRAIVNGTASPMPTTLPEAPAFVAGT